MSTISLTSSVRAGLESLKQTAALFERTTRRLSTGREVQSAMDNPTNYFAAQNYNDRSDALTERLDGIGQATGMINSADNGITNIRAFLSQMKGVVTEALANTDSSERRILGSQFNEIVLQVRDIAKDSSYGGINLLYSNASTTVQFGESIGNSQLLIRGFNVSAATGQLDGNGEIGSSSVLDTSGEAYAITVDVHGGSIVGIQSFGFHSAGGGGGDDHEVDWGGSDYQKSLQKVMQQIEGVDTALKGQSSKLATNLAILTQREEYSTRQITILQEGAENLVLADLNEETARLLTQETAQQLGVRSLQLASQNASSILSVVQ